MSRFDRPLRATLLATGIALWLGAPSAIAQPTLVALEPVQDATLYETPAGDLANGAGEGIFAGRTNQPPAVDQRRALLQFDLSPIPANASILSVELSLVIDQGAPGQSVSLHRLTESWSEGPSIPMGNGGGGTTALPGDVTWLHRVYPTDLWTTPGADFDPVASSTTVAGTGTSFPSTGALVDDVMDMLLDPSANHGWIIIGDESMPDTSNRFSSRENPAISQRPILTIEYAPEVPGPEFRRTDCDANGSFELFDVISLLQFLFSAGAAPLCQDACDVNDDGILGLADAIIGLNVIFSGAVPPEPYPGCGPDSTADFLSDCQPAGCP